MISPEYEAVSSKTKKGEEWKKSIEICECTTDGRLKKVSNFPMSLTNDTAKVDYITESISQELFDGVEVLLIDAENLENKGFHSHKR